MGLLDFHKICETVKAARFRGFVNNPKYVSLVIHVIEWDLLFYSQGNNYRNASDLDQIGRAHV